MIIVRVNKDYRLRCNSDGTDLKLVKYNYDEVMSIDLDAVKGLVAELIANKRIARLQSMTPDEILGL